MKKIKYLLLVCLIGILSTGCVKYNATMDIKKDKSMDFRIIYAFDKSLMGDGNSLKEEDFNELKKQGYTVSKYSEGNMEGFTIAKKFNNIDEISTEDDIEYNLSDMMEKQDNNYLFKVVKGSNKNTYYAKFKFEANQTEMDMNATNELPDESDEDGLLDSSNSLDSMDLSGLMSSMDLSFNVNLPSSAISNNATKAEDDNKKLTWTLTATDSQYIEFAFELSNGNNNMLLYIGGGILLVLVLLIIFIIIKNKKHPGEIIDNEKRREEVKEEVVTTIPMSEQEPEPVLNKQE